MGGRQMKLTALLVSTILAGTFALSPAVNNIYQYSYEREIGGSSVRVDVDSAYALSDKDLEQAWQQISPILEQDLKSIDCK